MVVVFPNYMFAAHVAITDPTTLGTMSLLNFRCRFGYVRHDFGVSLSVSSQ